MYFFLISVVMNPDFEVDLNPKRTKLFFYLQLKYIKRLNTNIIMSTLSSNILKSKIQNYMIFDIKTIILFHFLV